MNESMRGQLAAVRNTLFGSPIPKRRLSKPRVRKHPKRVFAAPNTSSVVQCNSVTVRLAF